MFVIVILGGWWRVGRNGSVKAKTEKGRKTNKIGTTIHK
jgi:hypothetical protein